MLLSKYWWYFGSWHYLHKNWDSRDGIWRGMTTAHATQYINNWARHLFTAVGDLMDFPHTIRFISCAFSWFNINRALYSFFCFWYCRKIFVIYCILFCLLIVFAFLAYAWILSYFSQYRFERYFHWLHDTSQFYAFWQMYACNTLGMDIMLRQNDYLLSHDTRHFFLFHIIFI